MTGDSETFKDMETVDLGDGLVLKVHDETVCNPDTPCVIHRPTPHHMADWRLHWRNDRAIFERICEHGVGHPDPDQFDFWRIIDQNWQAVHGCDGCCFNPEGVPVDDDSNI